MGLVIPGMVNVRAEPPVKVPAVIVMVNTGGVPAIAAVPAPPAPPAVKVRVPGEATASPAPLSVMMILPVGGMVDAGVRDTVMMTPVAPLTALLRVIAGWFAPSVAAEVSMHINNKSTQTIEDKVFHEWLIILVLLLFSCIYNSFCLPAPYPLHTSQKHLHAFHHRKPLSDGESSSPHHQIQLVSCKPLAY